MATKKYTLLFAVALLLLQTGVTGQTSDVTTTWKDSSKVASKNKAQFGEFSKNAYIYPAKPKDMWEIGLGIGVATVSGDLRNDPGLGITLTARKALSHTFSLRPYVSFYNVGGGTEDFGGTIPSATNYKTQSIGLGLDAVASLNTINSYRGNPKWNFYILAGFGLNTINVKQQNALGNYETFYVPSNANILTSFGDKKGDKGATVLIPCFNIGGGLAYKINERLNVAIEAKNSLTNYDYIDAFSSPFSNAFDAFWFSSARINFNIGNKSKRVEPLWWINPNNYVYSELNTPDHLKNKLKVKLDDADNDGITDQFDLQPNTPAGVTVDSHGRALDTDGDGVPDYKDKELLTRAECFPANADGVGTCPESACCKESKSEIIKLQQTVDSFRNGSLKGGNSGSVLPNLPSIQFKSGDAKLSRDNQRLLDAVAEQLKNNPNAKIKVLGHPEANKTSQQKAYDRVESIIKYLVEKKGISENRFIFAYDAGGSGDANTIDLQGTTEDGPNTVPAPAPHLKGN
jgi:outer membrane protein OmpA-like peptidoglycan-associated protein